MANSRDLTIKINAKLDVAGAINQAMSSFRGMADQVRGVIGGVTSSLFTMKNAIAGAFAGGFLRQALIEWGKQEDAISRLRLMVSNMGGDTDALTTRYAALAGQLQRVTRFADDDTEAMMAQLVVFGVTDAAMENTTKFVMNLAAATGQDLASASMQFGNILAGNIPRALKPYVGALDDSLSSSEQAGIAIERLTEKFNANGGAAFAMANTTNGAFVKMTNAIGEVMESLGDALAAAFGFSDAKSSFQQFVAAIYDNTENIKIIFVSVIDSVASFGKSFVSAIGNIIDIFKALYDVIDNIPGVVAVGVTALGMLAAYMLAMEFPIAATVVGLGVLGVALGQVQEFAQSLWVIWNKVCGWIVNQTSNMVRLVGLHFNTLMLNAAKIADAFGADESAAKIREWASSLMSGIDSATRGMDAFAARRDAGAMADLNAIRASNQALENSITTGFNRAREAYNQLKALASGASAATAAINTTVTGTVGGRAPGLDGSGSSGGSARATREQIDAERLLREEQQKTALASLMTETARRLEELRQRSEKEIEEYKRIAAANRFTQEQVSDWMVVHQTRFQIESNKITREAEEDRQKILREARDRNAKEEIETTAANVRFSIAERVRELEAFRDDQNATVEIKRLATEKINQLTKEQAEEMKRLRDAAFETAGSYMRDSSPMAAITDRYNQVLAALDEARIKGAITAEEFGAAMSRSRERFEKEWDPVAQAAQWGKSFEDMAAQVAGTMQSSLSDALVASLKGDNVWGAWNSFLTNIGNSLLKTVFDAVSTALIQASGIQAGLTGAFSGLFGGGKGGVKGGGGGLFGFLGSLFAADGAVWPGFQPIAAFAGGGMVTGPTLGLIGEGRYNEAIVPLPNGRSIPVEMRGGGDTYNININAVDARSFQQLLAESPDTIVGIVNRSKARNGAARQFDRSGY